MKKAIRNQNFPTQFAYIQKSLSFRYFQLTSTESSQTESHWSLDSLFRQISILKQSHSHVSFSSNSPLKNTHTHTKFRVWVLLETLKFTRNRHSQETETNKQFRHIFGSTAKFSSTPLAPPPFTTIQFAKKKIWDPMSPQTLFPHHPSRVTLSIYGFPCECGEICSVRGPAFGAGSHPTRLRIDDEGLITPPLPASNSNKKFLKQGFGVPSLLAPSFLRKSSDEGCLTVWLTVLLIDLGSTFAKHFVSNWDTSHRRPCSHHVN